MQLYPEKYDKLDLSAEEKSFIRTLDRAIPDDNLAYYVLHINPIKKIYVKESRSFLIS